MFKQYWKVKKGFDIDCKSPFPQETGNPNSYYELRFKRPLNTAVLANQPGDHLLPIVFRSTSAFTFCQVYFLGYTVLGYGCSIITGTITKVDQHGSLLICELNLSTEYIAAAAIDKQGDNDLPGKGHTAILGDASGTRDLECII